MNGQLLGFGIGVLLLVLGRKLFWLFVGVVGFLWGFQIASQLLPANSQIAILAAALVLGLVGAVLAIFVQHLVVILAGFLAGAHLVVRVLTLYNWDGQQFVWWIALLGGVLGAPSGTDDAGLGAHYPLVVDRCQPGNPSSASRSSHNRPLGVSPRHLRHHNSIATPSTSGSRGLNDRYLKATSG